MRVVLHYKQGLRHQEDNARLMKKGIERHGLRTELAPYDEPRDADIIVMWGWRQKAVIAAAAARNTPILVMERGHIQPRMEWISCGFGGIGRRGTHPRAEDGGLRWRQYFSHHLQAWRNTGSYALVCGQLPGDAALGDTDVHRWAQETIDTLAANGQEVRFRPHPLREKIGDTWNPLQASVSTASLAQDLAGARVVVTFNSTIGIEAVFAGTPTITCDVGSMAWPVATHSLDAPPATPDRTTWCHDLAWTQWLPKELGKGTAWDALKRVIPAR